MATRPKYNFLPVCVGAGGLELSLAIAVRNARTVCYVEREIQACEILAARMEDKTFDAAPIWSDLSTFDGKPWRGLVDCVVSSDPCQPNSIAGSRLGAADDRFLIDQLIRVIEEVRPARVFRENVTGNADGQLAALIPALERMGYGVAAGIFSAAEVGASHRRERLFIMADASGPRAGMASHRGGGQGRKPTSPLEPEILRQENGPRGSKGINPTKRELGNAKSLSTSGLSKRAKTEHARPIITSGDVANTIGSGQRRESYDSITSKQSYQSCAPFFAPGPNDPRWPDIIANRPDLAPAITKEAEREFRGMANGLANRTDRLRAAGNGVCSMAGAIAWLSLSAHFE